MCELVILECPPLCWSFVVQGYGCCIGSSSISECLIVFMVSKWWDAAVEFDDSGISLWLSKLVAFLVTSNHRDDTSVMINARILLSVLFILLRVYQFLFFISVLGVISRKCFKLKHCTLFNKHIEILKRYFFHLYLA